MSLRYETLLVQLRQPTVVICDLCGVEAPIGGTHTSCGVQQHVCPSCRPSWDAHGRAVDAHWRAREAAVAEFEARWDAEHPEPAFVWLVREGT